MKPRNFLPIILIVLLLPLPLLAPAVASLTYTYSVVQVQDTTDNNSISRDQMQAREFGDTVYLLYPVHQPSDGFELRKSNGELACPTCGSIWSGAITGHTVTLASAETIDFDVVSSTLLIACYVDGGDLFFTRSINGGGLWSGAVTVDSTTNLDPSNCAVDAFGSDYFVYYGDTTNTNVVYKKSTDSGQTWGSVTIVHSADETNGETMDIASNGDDGVLVFGEETGDELVSCKTIDASVTWTCVVSATETPALNVASVEVDFVQDDEYNLVFTDTGGNIRWCETVDVGATYVCTSAASSQSGSRGTALTVDPADDDNIAIAWGIGVGTDAFVRSVQSTDGGVTWSAVDDIVTDTADGQLFYTAIAHLWGETGGGIGVFYQTCETSADVNTACSSGGPAADQVTTRMADAAFGSGGTEPVGVKATAAVTNLVGFNVDPTGSRAVARVLGGDRVFIWGAKTLGAEEGNVETNCDLESKEDAVAAKYGGELVVFLNCDALGDPQFLSIRDPGGNVPTASELGDCEPGSADGQCPFDIGLSDFDEPFDSSLGQLGQIKDFPIDYSNIGSGTESPRRLAWAFSTQDPDPGEVGVATFVRRENFPDRNRIDTVGYSATVSEDFCVGLDGSQYYLVAVDTSESVKVWPVTFTDSSSELEPNVGGASSFGVSGASGIDCGGGQVAFVAGTTLYYATRSGTILDSFNLVDITVRGVAITEEYELDGDSCTNATAVSASPTCFQKVLAYKDDTDEILVFDATGGELVELGSLEVTVDGTFVELVVDGGGNGAWLAQTGQVDYYEIFNLTNEGVQVPSQCVIDCEEEDDEDGAAAGDFFDTGEVATSLDISVFGANLLFGAILMGLVSFGVGTGGGSLLETGTGTGRFRFSWVAAAIGAGIGFLLAWGFGFFSTGVVFSIVVLAAIGIGIKAWSSRG